MLKKIMSLHTFSVLLIMLLYGCSSDDTSKKAVNLTHPGFSNDKIMDNQLLNISFSSLPDAIKEKLSTSDLNDINQLSFYRKDFHQGIRIYFIQRSHDPPVEYYIYLENSQSNSITQEPILISEGVLINDESGFKEKLRLLTQPFIFLNDIDGDSSLELVIKDRVHNGNVYNAVKEIYFKIDSQTFNLKPWFFIESVSYDFLSHYYINRKLSNGNTVIVFYSATKDSLGKEIGSFSLKFLDDTVVFVNEKIINPEFSHILISSDL